MVLAWIVAAQPLFQAFVGTVFSAEGLVTLTGFYWVVYQALFGGGGAAVLGGLYNPPNHHQGDGGGGGANALARFARPIQLVLTLTLLGVFFKWPVTSALFAALWVGILLYTNVASAFFAAVTSTGSPAVVVTPPPTPSSSWTWTRTSTTPPASTPFLGATEGMLPTALVDAVASHAGGTSTARLAGWSPWIWLGLSLVGSWILCAFVADLLEDSARTMRRNLKRSLRYLLWTAPLQLAEFVCRTAVQCVHVLYRSAVRPAVQLCVRAVRRATRWVRGGNHHHHRAREGAEFAPPRVPARRAASRRNVRARDDPHDHHDDVNLHDQDEGRAIVSDNTGSQDDDNDNESSGSGSDDVVEPIVRTLINYWGDPSNKPYWDDNDDDDQEDDDYVDHEGDHYGDPKIDENGADDYDDDHELSMVDFEEEDELDVTPRRSSRLWERGL